MRRPQPLRGRDELLADLGDELGPRRVLAREVGGDAARRADAVVGVDRAGRGRRRRAAAGCRRPGRRRASRARPPAAIELWVPRNATSSTRRSHSAACPLHAPVRAGGAPSSDAAAATATPAAMTSAAAPARSPRTRCGPRMWLADGARRGGRHRDKRADRRDRDRPCAQRVDPDADCRADRVAVGRVDACRRHRRRGPREHGDDATGYGRSGPETERRVARRVGHQNRDESEHHRDTQRDPPGLPGAVRAFGEREQGAVDAAFHACDRGHHAGRDPSAGVGAHAPDGVGKKEAGVADAECDRVVVRAERRPVGVERGAAHERPELRRADDGSGAEEDDGPQRHEVGAGADRGVRQSARRGGPHRLAVDRRRHASGERVRSKERAVGVGQQRRGRERDRGERGRHPRGRRSTHRAVTRPSASRTG